MDTRECQPLYLEIQKFYEDLNMKVEQKVPMLLVERQALNGTMEGENVVCFSMAKKKEVSLFFSPLYH